MKVNSLPHKESRQPAAVLADCSNFSNPTPEEMRYDIANRFPFLDNPCERRCPFTFTGNCPKKAK